MFFRNSRSLITCCSVIFLASLNGCAHKQAKPESSKITQNVNPEKSDLSPVTNNERNDATLIFKSAGMPMHVTYEISSNEENCEGFERVGKVFHSGRETLLPWIAKLTEAANKAVLRAHAKLDKKVPGNQAIQIRGHSSWGGGSCGPLMLKFIPEYSKTYLVEFSFSGTSSCAQNVFEMTSPSEKKEVVVQHIASCSR